MASQPKFVYLCAQGSCGRQCRFKRASIKGELDGGKKVTTQGLGKPNCPTHGPTKAHRVEIKTKQAEGE